MGGRRSIIGSPFGSASESLIRAPNCSSKKSYSSLTAICNLDNNIIYAKRGTLKRIVEICRRMKLFERMLVLVFMYMDVTFVLGGWGVEDL